ncbi:MAG: DNA topoisomerase IV subunit B [Proteobacteria bacterium]|nr:MAG: DNA topoisomerase IV subunit B [Pseudomonadota bacterium]
MVAKYDAADIEVLTGLDPVRKRPAMFTDTTRPNHLVQEVVDNSVDEAIVGFCAQIDVVMHRDGSVSVADDGRGMPVDKHPGEKITGVEVILTRLHAGAKFSTKNYKYSGGLHGVGVSVVNALSKRLEVAVKRGGRVHEMSFAKGKRRSSLKVAGKVGRQNTGTTIRFWPDPKYFDTVKLSVPKLRHVLRAKAVLCPGLRMRLTDEAANTRDEWHYQAGLRSYLAEAMPDAELLPATPFQQDMKGNDEAVTWALQWRADEGEVITESYVNLVPTAHGGTHVTGLRQGLLEAMREFCDFRSLLPRGVKLTADDVIERCAFILSVKLSDPQFSGQTKERLSSRSSATFVAGVVRDAFSLWLHQHAGTGERIAEIAVQRAQKRLKAAKSVVRKKLGGVGPALPGKLADCISQNLDETELFLVEGDSAGGSAKQARDKDTQAILPLRGKILNTWEVESSQVLASQEVHDISVALGVDPGSSNISRLRYGKLCILADADSDGAHIATLLCALFVRHFRRIVEAGHVYVAMPPLYRIDIGKAVYYALDEDEKAGIIDRIAAEKINGKVSVQRFKGLGEMNPLQLRETSMAPETRRLIQLTIDNSGHTEQLMDMLLAKKRAPDRRAWLESKGNLLSRD